jgi:acyl-CoA hydrolase
MKLVDDVAGVVAHRHSGGPAVIASMNEMAV